MKTQEILDKYHKLIVGLLPETAGAIIQFKVEIEVNVGQPSQTKVWAPINGFVYLKPDLKVKQDWALGRYQVMLNQRRLAEFELYQMPHCCGIAVSCRALVAPEYRKRGLGALFNMFRQDIARQLGFSLLMCTDVAQNEPQRKLLKTNGWKDLISFVNQRTRNTVYVCAIGL